jgi:predicted dehydrogenase
MTLKVAIVGLGGIGNTHARVYKARQDCELVAVCDILHERADKAAAAYGARAFYSVQEMLDSGLQLDAVSVATAGVENGGDHYKPTMELLNAGLPVLGEKPISNELSKAAEMVALAKQKGLRYGVDLNHRFTPAAQMARQWVDEGRLGEINLINMIMWINNPNESSPWFHMRALHPHSIDVMRYFGGDVEKVQAFFKKGAGRKIWSNVQVNMVFKNGIIGHLAGSYDATGPGGSYGLERLEVAGMDARFVLDDACEHLKFCPRRSKETVTYDYVGGMMSFSETFASRIGRWVEQNIAQVAPEEIDGSGEDAYRAQQVIEAAIYSFEHETIVTLE